MKNAQTAFFIGSARPNGASLDFCLRKNQTALGPVRAVWCDEKNAWYFSVLDIVGVLCDQSDYNKNRNYWKYLKAKLKKEKSELVSDATQLPLLAPDGKKHKSDCLNASNVVLLAKSFPSKKANRFIEFNLCPRERTRLISQVLLAKLEVKSNGDILAV